MDFAYDDTTLELQERLIAFMDECVYPAEELFRHEAETAENRWGTPPVLEELKLEARRRGKRFCGAMARPRKYPDELIQRGIRLALEGDRPIAHTVHDLGMRPRRWRNDAQHLLIGNH